VARGVAWQSSTCCVRARRISSPRALTACMMALQHLSSHTDAANSPLLLLLLLLR